MAPLKSPGPNGFPACFYQDQWETMGPEVCDAILNFVKGVVLMRMLIARILY
jgi:hypothetical protein